MGKLVLTDRPDEFASVLQAGDLLLFDSMSLVAGLTQWADKSPFNHIALVMDEKTILEANRKTPSTPHSEVAEVPGDERAVRSVKLEKRLHQSGISTITVVRHQHAASGGTNLGPVTARASSYLERADRFSQVDLALIGQERFLLNYGKELGQIKYKRAWEYIFFFSELLVASVGNGQRSISCSEFVYRCFVESGVPEFKLGRTKIPHKKDDDDLDHNPIAADEVRQFRALRQELLARNAEAVAQFEDDGWAPHPLPLADRISPGDFARSEEFDRIAVLNHDRKIISPPEEGAGAN